MTSSDAFAHISYIRTSAERLWQALTDPAFTTRYWGVAFDTDWSEGSRMAWREGGRTTADPEQVVVAAEPGRRLAYTWHTFTDAWAEGNGVDRDLAEALRGEPRTTVSFTLEPVGGMVRLSLVHDGFPAGSTVRTMVADGWPLILSSLKTLLETGEPLPAPA